MNTTWPLLARNDQDLCLPQGWSPTKGPFSQQSTYFTAHRSLVRYPSYQSGTQEEDEERRSPLTEEEEGMGSKVEVEGTAIAYNNTTNHDINDINGEEEKVDEEEEEDTLPQDLSMISNRNVDS